MVDLENVQHLVEQLQAATAEMMGDLAECTAEMSEADRSVIAIYHETAESACSPSA